MPFSFDKIAEKVGVVVQGGTVNIGEVRIERDKQDRRDKNERKLVNQVKSEIYGRLKKSLQFEQINLSKSLNSELVSSVWDSEVKVGSKSIELISDDCSILDVFNRHEIIGKLLILGAAGTGKTVTLLSLAKSLIEEYLEKDIDFPIPVLLNLSSWKTQSITSWLINELKIKYGINLATSSKLVQEGKLLPLLDGLDELREDLRKDCVVEINSFLRGSEGEIPPEYLVVCCRREEYKAIGTPLSLNGAIEVDKLTYEQIHDFLSNSVSISFAQFILADYEIWEIVETPLMLTVATMVYKAISPEEWSNEKRSYQALWDKYIKLLLKPNSNAKYTFEECIKWLTLIASEMTLKKKENFVVANLMPYECEIAINSRSRERAYPVAKRTYFYFSIAHLTLRLLLAGVLAHFFLYIFELAIFDGFLFTVTANIVLTVLAFFFYLILGILFKALEIHGLSNSFRWDFSVYDICKVENSIDLIKGILFENCFYNMAWIPPLICALIFFSGIASDSGGITSDQNQIKMAASLSIVSFPYIFLLCPFFGSHGKLDELLRSSAGRMALFKKGYIPWNCKKFLDYCCENLILQKSGNRYQFVHILLQEYFVDIYCGRALRTMTD